MKKQLLFYCGLAVAGNSLAQSIGPVTMNSTGASASHSSGIYDWSIGEMALVNTFSTSGLIITQGVLQIEPGAVAIGEHHHSLFSNVHVFPNPSQDAIYVESTFAMAGKLMYSLVDIAGRTILKGESNVAPGNEKEKIDISALVPGSYFLQVFVKQEEETFVQSYQVQKN